MACLGAGGIEVKERKGNGWVTNEEKISIVNFDSCRNSYAKSINF